MCGVVAHTFFFHTTKSSELFRIKALDPPRNKHSIRFVINSNEDRAHYPPKLTSAISVVQLHQQVELLWRTVEGPRAAVRCGWTRWWLETEEEGWPSVFELLETAPCCPGGWMAAAGTATPWPPTPGPKQQDDYARNSFGQVERSGGKW